MAKHRMPVMQKLSVFSPAKVNLYLGVSDKKGKKPGSEDEFHYLSSIFHLLDFGDVLHFEENDSFEIVLSGPFAQKQIHLKDNLIYKAAQMFADKPEDELKIKITLEKNIPLQSGLGGGSSNAAAALWGLNEFLKAGYSMDQLRDKARSIGSDVVIFLYDKPVLMQGFGDEFVESYEAFDAPVVLIKPEDGVSTKEAYKQFDSFQDLAMPAKLLIIGMQSHDLEIVATHLSNNLEIAASDLVPEIPHMLRWLGNQPGAYLAHVSGSGSCIFSIFETMDEAKAAAELAAQEGYWSQVCRLATKGIREI